MKRRELKAEVIERKFDGAWQVVTPASLVRLNETSRELVRKGEAVDLTRWITVFVGKSKKECDKWLDTNKGSVLRLSTPYEVA